VNGERRNRLVAQRGVARMKCSSNTLAPVPMSRAYLGPLATTQSRRRMTKS
jgi:hypothetical protein